MKFKILILLMASITLQAIEYRESEINTGPGNGTFIAHEKIWHDKNLDLTIKVTTVEAGYWKIEVFTGTGNKDEVIMWETFSNGSLKIIGQMYQGTNTCYIMKNHFDKDGEIAVSRTEQKKTMKDEDYLSIIFKNPMEFFVFKYEIGGGLTLMSAPDRQNSGENKN
jgi:hypothetical protein